ncbi:MAG TPA: NAD-dependent epimerase/dehydratase family protein [Acidimicrobiales bacterium]|nr:NAD-dependent epimerase/dehydratase family protein [Acidimicrobiales bacterium]
MRVLVTGGGGFLGRHLVRACIADGAEVDVVEVRPVPPEPGCASWVTADMTAWLPTVDRRYDLVVHLAARIGGRTGIEHQPFVVASNTGLDAVLFDFAARTRPQRVTYVSSSAVYPIDRQMTLDAHPLQECEVELARGVVGSPDLTYGWSKLCGEHMAGLLQDRFGVDVTVYRPFTVFGPGQSDDYPLTAIAQRALERRDPLTVWGTGRQQRDLVFIDDFVDVFRATWAEGDPGRPMNIATGVATSFIDVATCAARIAGYDATIEPQLDRPEGVRCRVGSPARIPLRVRPRTTLESGLRELMTWLEAR